jgi:hypothetical protein
MRPATLAALAGLLIVIFGAAVVQLFFLAR